MQATTPKSTTMTYSRGTRPIVLPEKCGIRLAIKRATDQYIDDFERYHGAHIGNRKNREVEVQRQKRDNGAGWRRHAGKKMRLPGWPVRIVDHDIEAGKAQRRRDRENKRREPAETLHLVQTPKVKDQRRRDTKINEVGKRVEFGAKARRSTQHAGDPSVQTIQYGGGDDRDNGDLELAFDCETDRGETHAQREQGDEIGHDDAQRHRPQSPPARRLAEIFESAGIVAQRPHLPAVSLGVDFPDARILTRIWYFVYWIHAHFFNIKETWSPPQDLIAAKKRL